MTVKLSKKSKAANKDMDVIEVAIEFMRNFFLEKLNLSKNL